MTWGVRSRGGLLGKCESAGLRNQRRGSHVAEKGATTGGEIGKGILLVLLTRSEHGEKTFHKATAALTGRAITGLAPLDGMAKARSATLLVSSISGIRTKVHKARSLAKSSRQVAAVF